MEFDDNISVNTAIGVIVLGVIIMTVAFFGCCGACKENSCMMYTHSTLLGLIFVTLIGLTVAFVVYKDDIEEFVKDELEKAMDPNNYNNSTAHFDLSSLIGKVSNSTPFDTI